MSGLQNLQFTVPGTWDARWFQLFVRDVLSKADVRNATGTPGVTVTGDPTTVATIAYTFDDATQQFANRVFAGPQMNAPTIESSGLNVTAFPRPSPTPPPVDDSQAVLAMEIFL